MIVSPHSLEKKILRKTLLDQRRTFLHSQQDSYSPYKGKFGIEAKPTLSPVSVLIKNLRFYVLDKASTFSRPLIVGGVWPLKGEPDLRSLFYDFYRIGVRVALPRVVRKESPLKFIEWSPFSILQDGLYKTCSPIGVFLEPDVLFVPLLGFNKKGYRIGYGGGFYDRTLALRPHCLSVGYGFSWQEVENLFYEDHDVPVKVIITEQGLLQTGLSHGKNEKRSKG
ncbi:5-formyltetrahydrofolate cyclo-ligase [Entomobacter blattae]|uniref:5-formyltetrahydrofolate cyclo-ligase n=1 Tax=Entomobacter blattae TaxID=2762277 RepID=A0A7H1NTA9_9PROT|nr:5-formyltetrahydrofolate cyclo-ligase [Entomobacter blattae]QNT79019.1 5-formyltetrahydrofolate cyclo-ligase family protein [Entomobacter blattae]